MGTLSETDPGFRSSANGEEMLTLGMEARLQRSSCWCSLCFGRITRLLSMRRISLVLTSALIVFGQLGSPFCTMEGGSSESPDKVAESHHQSDDSPHSQSPTCPTFIGCSTSAITTPSVTWVGLPPSVLAVEKSYIRGISAPAPDIKSPPPRSLI